MKRASYREAIAWIAGNDSDGEDTSFEVEVVSELVTTCLVADLFGKTPRQVATAIVAFREKYVAEVGGEF